MVRFASKDLVTFRVRVFCSISYQTYEHPGPSLNFLFTSNSDVLEGIFRVYKYLENHPHLPRSLIIYSDSQAALQALNNSFVTSRLVHQCISSLNALGTTTHVLLRYVKAHSGHEGNEIADFQAKLAVSLPVPYTNPILPLSGPKDGSYLRPVKLKYGSLRLHPINHSIYSRNLGSSSPAPSGSSPDTASSDASGS